MKRIERWFFFLCLWGITQAIGATTSNEDILKQLDRILEQKSTFHSQKEQSISNLRQRLNRTTDYLQKYNLCGDLFQEFLHYQADSALHYINVRLQILPLLNRPDLKSIIIINQAEVMGVMGMYNEALELLKKVDPSKLQKETLGYYYHAYRAYYGWIADYTSHVAEKMKYLQKTDLSVKKSFTDKELVCGTLIYGVGKMWVKDSERYLSAASNQAKASNIEYSQAQTICAILDGIIARADRMAELLKSMNFLFRKSISHTADVIEKNGFNIRNYTQEEKGVLMTCANFALAVVDIINTPIYDESGKLAEAAIDAIECGENYINAVSEVINNY